MSLKTWEVMKLLAENPNLRFKNESFDYGEGAYLGISTGGTYKFYNTKAEYATAKSFNDMWLSAVDEWELISTKVDFMDAVKAHNEGRRIYCMMKGTGVKNVYRPSLSSCMKDEEGLPITSDEILNGEWHIDCYA